MITIIRYPARNLWAQLVQRPTLSTEELEHKVVPVLEAVRTRGDAALREFTAQFDRIRLEEFTVSQQERAAAYEQLPDDLKRALVLAKSNIERFHLTQAEESRRVETQPGVVCWRKSVAMRRVGFYIPGGTAPLFSTVLMLGVPAQIAGCETKILCSPPNSEGNIHPAIIFAANLVGIDTIFKVGGAQAIAAMAFGTESIPKVDKIFGPGNQYVTIAKQLVQRSGMAIDMPAGPSEVAVLADESCVPAFVAADLLSQAEHGADSQVVLASTSERVLEAVVSEVRTQLKTLPRRALAEQALQNSRALLFSTMNEAVDFLNDYAPEHLILATAEAERLAEGVVNAGSVFLGNYSPEAAGDYASGTNHTLPTNGYARAYSGVSVDSFVKKITFQHLTAEGLRTIGGAVETMAAAEGLEAHKRAVSVRLLQR